jgi:hypothetical protein
MKISVKDLNVGDMVAGMHVDDRAEWQYKTVAGKIISKEVANDGVVTYKVKGKTFLRNFRKHADLSGILVENEVEVTDPNVCNMIIELLEDGIKKLNKGLLDIGLETALKAHEMRHKSRKELEEKYAIVMKSINCSEELG